MTIIDHGLLDGQRWKSNIAEIEAITSSLELKRRLRHTVAVLKRDPGMGCYRRLSAERILWSPMRIVFEAVP